MHAENHSLYTENGLTSNPLFDTDSYKLSHWLQYPPETQETFFYLESRGGLHNKTVFFGLQAILKVLMATPITHAMVDEVAEVAKWHGEPFNAEGFHKMVDRYHGKWPVRIRAVREGTVVPTGQVLMTMQSTDPEFYWIPSYLEPQIMRVWYTTTVASISWHIKQAIRVALRETSDDPEAVLPFKLHDFGSRGVSSRESAALGGVAHLVNFLGTDTVMALRAAKCFYHEDQAGFSIPAAEHSTITSWGREREREAYRNMLRTFGKPGALLSVVSDSYDIYNAIDVEWAALKDEIIASGATVVIRPDSGDPVSVVTKCLEKLDAVFGSTLNKKGYKVLNHVRLIQGDGVNPDSINEIIASVISKGFSIDNVAFGMGGALLQKCDRDTQKFALKCSAARINGEWVDVFKDPVTDTDKRSKKGLLTLLRHYETGEYRSAHPDEADTKWVDVLHTIFENGELVREWTLKEVRSRAEAPV